MAALRVHCHIVTYICVQICFTQSVSLRGGDIFDQFIPLSPQNVLLGFLDIIDWEDLVHLYHLVGNSVCCDIYF